MELVRGGVFGMWNSLKRALNLRRCFTFFFFWCSGMWKRSFSCASWNGDRIAAGVQHASLWPCHAGERALHLAAAGCDGSVARVADDKVCRVKPLALTLCLLFPGCGGSPTGETQIKSQFFSAVKVFGTRGAGVGQFNKPRSVAVDRKDNFYVVDMTGRVQKFSPDGQFLLHGKCRKPTKANPRGWFAIKTEISSWSNLITRRLNHFTPDGQLVTQWGHEGRAVGELTFPRSVAVNSRGEVYVSEYGLAERIQHFRPLGKKFIGSFGGPGNGTVNSIAPKGSAWITRITFTWRIPAITASQIFSREGKFIAAFGNSRERHWRNELSLRRAGGSTAGYEFVCEFGNSRIQIFDPQSHVIEILGGVGRLIRAR